MTIMIITIKKYNNNDSKITMIMIITIAIIITKTTMYQQKCINNNNNNNVPTETPWFENPDSINYIGLFRSCSRHIMRIVIKIAPTIKTTDLKQYAEKRVGWGHLYHTHLKQTYRNTDYTQGPSGSNIAPQNFPALCNRQWIEKCSTAEYIYRYKQDTEKYLW